MQYNNFTQTKKSQNSKLFTLLTKRSKAKSVANIRNDWPGLFNPNFTSNIKYKSNQNHHQILKKTKSQSLMVPSLIPVTPVTLKGDMSLKPDLHNKITFKRQPSRQSGRYSGSKTARNKVSIIRIQQNQDAMNQTKSTIFKNPTINNKVNQIIDQQIYLTARKQAKQNISNIVNERQFLNTNGFNRTHNKLKMRSDLKQKNEKQYKVDFFAFGYIQKIIDNPQLWQKYVHKIHKNQQQKPVLLTQFNLIKQDS